MSTDSESRSDISGESEKVSQEEFSSDDFPGVTESDDGIIINKRIDYSRSSNFDRYNSLEDHEFDDPPPPISVSSNSDSNEKKKTPRFSSGKVDSHEDGYDSNDFTTTPNEVPTFGKTKLKKTTSSNEENVYGFTDDDFGDVPDATVEFDTPKKKREEEDILQELEIAELREEKEEIKREIEENSDELLLIRLQRFINFMQSKNADLSKLPHKDKTQRKKKVNREEILNELQREIQNLKKTVSENETKMEIEKKKLIDSYVEELLKKEREIDSMTRKSVEGSDEIELQNSVINELRSTKFTLEDRIELIEKEMEVKDEKIENLDDQRTKLLERLNEESSKIRKLKSKLKKQKNRNLKEMEDAKLQISDIDSLLKGRSEKHEEEKKEMRSQIEKLELRIKKEMVRKKKEMDDAKEEIRNIDELLKKQDEVHKEEKEKLEDQIDELKDEIKEERSGFLRRKEEEKVAKLVMKKLKRQSENHKAEKQELLKKIARFEEEVRLRDGQLEHVSSKFAETVDESERNIEELKREFRSEVAKEVNLRGKLEELAVAYEQDAELHEQTLGQLKNALETAKKVEIKKNENYSQSRISVVVIEENVHKLEEMLNTDHEKMTSFLNHLETGRKEFENFVKKVEKKLEKSQINDQNRGGRRRVPKNFGYFKLGMTCLFVVCFVLLIDLVILE